MIYYYGNHKMIYSKIIDEFRDIMSQKDIDRAVFVALASMIWADITNNPEQNNGNKKKCVKVISDLFFEENGGFKKNLEIDVAP